MLTNKLKKALLVLLFFPVMSFASEEITILWGFNSLGSNQANILRAMADDMNKAQSKYMFVFQGKLGAGGTVAANAVQSNPNHTLVGMSSSFFIRPFFEKTEPTHNLDNYKPILVQAMGSPLVFISGKYASLDDALKNNKLSVGVSGIGSVSHLAANELLTLNPNIVIVNFKSMIDAGVATAGGHVDIAVAIYGDTKSLVAADKVKVIAYTGNKDLFGLKNKKLSNYGLADSTGVTANYAIFASKSMDTDRFNEIQQLLQTAHRKQSILAIHVDDLLDPVMYTQPENDKWYESQKTFWKRKVATLKYVE